jgi:enoyl-CoA hydratase/carnithine racemase
MKSMAYMSDVVPAMRGIPQPIIAAINGPAYGGGMCLTLGADLRYAAASAQFCSAGIINGLTSSELGATYLLPRAVGTSNAAELLLTKAQDRRPGSAAHRPRLEGARRRRVARPRQHRRGDAPVRSA